MLFLRNSSLAILLIAQINFCLADNSNNIDLTKSVSEQQQLLPRELSTELLLTDINYNKQKQTLSYSVTAIDTKSEEINISKMADSVCYKPQLRHAIQEGLAVSFFFYAPNKKLLNSISITESSCKNHFKMQEELIQQDIKQFNSTILPEKIDDNLSIIKLNYQDANQTIIASLQANNKNIEQQAIDQSLLVNFTCDHYYFRLMLNKNVNIQYDLLNSSEKLIVTLADCKIGKLSPLDKQLTDEAEKMKANLKTLSTDQIEIIDVGYNPEKKQAWNKAVIKIPNITKDKLNPNLNIRAICATPSIRNIINQGISYLYSYYDVNNKLIMEFNVNESTCKQMDKENNILLKQPNK